MIHVDPISKGGLIKFLIKSSRIDIGKNYTFLVTLSLFVTHT